MKFHVHDFKQEQRNSLAGWRLCCQNCDDHCVQDQSTQRFSVKVFVQLLLTLLSIFILFQNGTYWSKRC